MTYIGIDPGMKGAIAVYRNGIMSAKPFDRMPFNDSIALSFAKQPTSTMYQISLIIKKAGPDTRILIEKPFAAPGRGAGLTKLFAVYGMIAGWAYTESSAIIAVCPPKKWQKAVGVRKVKGEKSGELALARERLGDAFIGSCKFGKRATPHDGMIDAALLALAASDDDFWNGLAEGIL